MCLLGHSCTVYTQSPAQTSCLRPDLHSPTSGHVASFPVQYPLGSGMETGNEARHGAALHVVGARIRSFLGVSVVVELSWRILKPLEMTLLLFMLATFNGK